MATERTESTILTKIQEYEDRLTAVLITSATRLNPAAYDYQIGNTRVNVGTYLKHLNEQLAYWRNQLAYVRASSGGEQWTGPDYNTTEYGEDDSTYIDDVDYSDFEDI